MPARPTLALAALAACLVCARPGGALTLDQAQAEALARNPALRALDDRVRAAQARCAQALAPFLPRLDVDGQHLFQGQYGSTDIAFPAFGFNDLAFPTAFPQDTLDVRVGWTVFDGWRGVRGRQAALAEARAALLQRSYAAERLRFKVATAFYQALASRLLVDAAEADTRTLAEHLRLARDYEESGGITHFGVLRVEAQSEEAQAVLRQARDAAALARLDLASAMGLSADARPLEGALPVPDPAAVPASLEPDLDRRADFRALELKVRALKRRREALLAAWAPSLSLFADQEYYRYGDFNPEILPTSGFPYQRMVGAQATWNLFDGGLDKARWDEAAAQEQGAKDSLDSSRLEALKDFAAWKDRFRDGVDLYRARLKVLKRSLESVRLARLGLRAGTVTDSEVLDAEMDLSRARAGLVQAQASADEALLNLRLLSGGTLR